MFVLVSLHEMISDKLKGGTKTMACLIDNSHGKNGYGYEYWIYEM